MNKTNKMNKHLQKITKKRKYKKNNFTKIKKFTKGKRKYYEMINNENKFQTIINSVSSSGVYMPEFYKFLYKRKHENISEEELDEHMNNVSIYNSRDDYKKDKEQTKVSIYFNRGHWYTSINNNTFDSFKSKIQVPRTNSFCQSYAIYLAVNECNIGEFQVEKYAMNIQKMACLHLEFIDSIHEMDYNDFYNDFVETFKEINLKPVKLETLKLYLQEICDDIKIANEFSTSKEDFV
jgi:hypothetical protein